MSASRSQAPSKNQQRLLVSLLVLTGAITAPAQTLSIDWSRIAGGGGTSTGVGYAVSGTMGQPDAGGPLTGGPYSMAGGYWAMAFAVPTPDVPFMATVHVGNAGNAANVTSGGTFGAVDYEYYIGTYEVTVAQYTKFLNAKARTGGPPRLYDLNQVDHLYRTIDRSGTSGNYTYTARPGFENRPVNFVNFYYAARFANWVMNGADEQADTETGFYTFGAGGANFIVSQGPHSGHPINGRNWVAVTSENEWYKAAYYKAASQTYQLYPTVLGVGIASQPPGAVGSGGMNINRAVNDNTTDVGAYSNAPSPYGTFDQGGNLWELNDGVQENSYVGVRGSSFKVEGAVDEPVLGFFTRTDSTTIRKTPDRYFEVGFRLSSLAPIISPPKLSIVPTGPGQATISWTHATPGYVLQETASLTSPNWTDAPSGAVNPVTVPAMLPTKFYRLRKP